MVDKLHVLSGPHCNISTYSQHFESKFSIHTDFDTLISNLNSYNQYKSLWFSVTNYFLFGRYFSYNMLFHNLCQKKQTVWKIAEKWDFICQKANIMLMTSSRTRETSINSNPTFSVKISICAKWFVPSLNRIKDEEAATILMLDCFQQFSTLTEQRWRHSRHSDFIWLVWSHTTAAECQIS